MLDQLRQKETKDELEAVEQAFRELVEEHIQFGFDKTGRFGMPLWGRERYALAIIPPGSECNFAISQLVVAYLEGFPNQMTSVVLSLDVQIPGFWHEGPGGGKSQNNCSRIACMW